MQPAHANGPSLGIRRDGEPCHSAQHVEGDAVLSGDRFDCRPLGLLVQIKKSAQF